MNLFRNFRLRFVPIGSADPIVRLGGLERNGAAVTLLRTPTAFLDIDPLPGHTVTAIPLDPVFVGDGVRLIPGRIAHVSGGRRLYVRAAAPGRVALLTHPCPVGREMHFDLESSGFREALCHLASSQTGQRAAFSDGNSLDEVLRNAETARPSTNVAAARNASTLLKIDRYLHDNIANAVYNGAVAKEAGISTRTLHTVMTQIRGMGVSRYVQLVRLWNIYNALDRGTLIKSVAIDHGYIHLARFSTDFRQNFGLLPREVRRLRAHENFVPFDLASAEPDAGAPAVHAPERETCVAIGI